MQVTRNPALSRLQPLVGEWKVVALIGGKPMATGRTRFEWLEGEAFLIQHAEADPIPPGSPPEWSANNPYPLTTIFGLDEVDGTFAMLYADARRVCRVYKMTLSDGVWKIWGRSGPSFFQRFSADFSPDERSISGRWDMSRDDRSWKTDFDVEYSKLP